MKLQGYEIAFWEKVLVACIGRPPETKYGTSSLRSTSIEEAIAAADDAVKARKARVVIPGPEEPYR